MSATSPFHLLWRRQRLLGPGNAAKAPSTTEGSPADAQASTTAGSPSWIPRLPAVFKERWLGFLYRIKKLVCIRNSLGVGGNFLWAGTSNLLHLDEFRIFSNQFELRLSHFFEPIRTQEFRVFSNQFELKKHFFSYVFEQCFRTFSYFLKFFRTRFLIYFRRTDIFFVPLFRMFSNNE